MEPSDNLLQITLDKDKTQVKACGKYINSTSIDEIATFIKLGGKMNVELKFWSDNKLKSKHFYGEDDFLINLVEILQRGKEKVLACVAATYEIYITYVVKYSDFLDERKYNVTDDLKTALRLYSKRICGDEPKTQQEYDELYELTIDRVIFWVPEYGKYLLLMSHLK